MTFSGHILHPACFLVFLFFLTFFQPLFAYALDVPKLQGYINDYANMISYPTKAELEKELKAFEQTDSTQIVILTIPSLEGEVIEDFSIKVAESWKIGQKVKDNGIIFLVAKEERKMRIEVGRGLEGKVTDLMAGRIIDLVIKPRFKGGDFDGGFIAGVSALIDATRGEFKADNRYSHGIKKELHPLLKIITMCIIGVIVLFIAIAGSASRIFGGILGGIAGAVGLPLLVHLIIFPIGIAAIIILAVLGLCAGVFLALLLSSAFQYRGPGGGFYWGGGGFSGGDFGGGGFSGGGGGFGGGGASGGW
jgi:uncharacterized protein